MYSLAAFFCGLLFGLGLTISNLINPNKVLNFLDVTGSWDPTLLLVMAAALAVTFLGYRMVYTLHKPWMADQFHLPANKKIDKKLLIGSVLFGIGWGVAGYCPGPGITALATLNTDPLYFVLGMVAGSFAYWGVSRK